MAILGTIIGKTSTTQFKFKVIHEAKKYQYVKILIQNSYVLAQVVEIEKSIDETIASCIILGFKEESGLKSLRVPLSPLAEVHEAEESIIQESLNIMQENGAFLGTLDYTNLKVYIDLNKLLTKHISILAKSGSGKSYTAACLIEEILDRNIPLVILDPHAEYSSLKKPNLQEKEKLSRLKLKPKDYSQNIQEYTPDAKINSDAKQLKLSLSSISPSDLLHMLPAKLSNMQIGLLYSSLQNIDKINFDDLILSLDTEETNAKYAIMNLIEQIKKLNIFSEIPTSLQELVQPGKASIINFKGISPEISEIVVFKLVRDLFEARKLGNIPPFFLVIEEAQNFAPERSFGESKSSPVLRRVLAEGRKFGLGVCLITQRPSRIDKSVLSQCTTQIILKVTNPNDLRAIASSVEGITSETEKEIRNLPIGTALLVGVVSQPLFVNIRPRKSKHGGDAIDIIGSVKEETPKNEEKVDKSNNDLLPVIRQKISLKDLELMSSKKIHSKEVLLIPCLFLQLQQDSNSFNILVNLYDRKIVNNLEHSINIQLPQFQLSENQLKIVRLAVKLKEFTPAQLFNLSKLQFSEVYDIIKNLTEKNLFLKQDVNKFILNKQLEILSDIQKYSCLFKPEYIKLNYNKKLEPKYDKQEIINLFSKFFHILNSKDCFIEAFNITYESKEALPG